MPNLRNRTVTPTPLQNRSATERRAQLNKWLSRNTPTPRQQEVIAMMELYINTLALTTRPTTTFISDINRKLDTMFRLLG